MRWTSWWPRLSPRHFSVVGLDVGPDACCLVVLRGLPSQPDRVCCAERLALPEGLVAHGEVLQPAALGVWLRTYLKTSGCQPEWAYLGLDSACVSHHLVSLAAGLSPDDVVFQLQAEVQSILPEHASDVCIDYSADTQASPVGESRYWVQAAPRLRVEALQRVAQHAGFKAVVVEPRQDAAHRAAQSHALLPNRAALAPHCSEALGLALRAWHDGGVNFLPHREGAQRVLGRAWWLGVAVCAMAGAFWAAGFAMLVASAAQSKQPPLADVAASARAFDKAQQAHTHAKAQQDRYAAQVRWLKAKQDVQSQSLQWSRVLSHAAQGVWVTSVKQQGARWTVHGEALSSQHAQQLVRQLKALDIWAQAPELAQLHVMPAVSATGWPVWQFRIEADLKMEAS